jgi:P-type Cu+ transporter
MATDPICGMWVDERSTALSLARDNRNYYFCSESCRELFSDPTRARRRLLARLGVVWPLAIAVGVLTYAVPGETATLLAAACATVVQGYGGAPFYAGTRDAVRERAWNMDVLIAVGTTTAYLYSVAVLVVPGRLPHAYYFDASALILALILTGNYLEHLTRDRASSALQRLHELVPETARVLRDGSERTVAVGELAVGDRIRVAPGARFPADGVVLAGSTSVDESLLTGESSRVPKSPGASVIAASVNGEGSVDIGVEKVGSDTFLAEVGRLLTDAETSRVPMQRTADRIAAAFVPFVLGLALAGAAFWFAVGGAGPTVALLVFVTVAITACPCAFGLATPAAILSGAGRAGEEGVLFRGEDAIERAARIDLVLMDKTGTLTVGEPSVTAIRPLGAVPTEEVLAVAAAVETQSEHPFGRAVVRAATARGVRAPTATDVRAVPGRGVRGTVNGHVVDVVAGTTPAAQPALRELDAAGQSHALVLQDGSPIGVLGFLDGLAPGAEEAVRRLRDEGIPVVLVTGDSESAARATARAVGISEVHANARPADKVALVERFRSSGWRVAFVGDGINDAPSLAAADLGIAIGTGTAVAREAGSVVLVRSDLRGVPFALRIARRTVAKVRGNLRWAIGYNAVLLPIAMGALVPLLGLSVYSVLPIAGAAAMGLSSTSVVANSLSLRRAQWTDPRPADATPPLPTPAGARGV